MRAVIKIIEDRQGSASNELKELKKWLQAESFDDLKIEEEHKSSPDNMGDIETILALAYLARPIIIEIIKSINVWIKERKPQAKIKFIDYETEKEFELDLQNIKGSDEAISKIIEKL